MRSRLKIGDIPLDVIRKKIKNIHLSVHPPLGRVTISVPVRLSLDSVRLFAISKVGWIRQQQKKLMLQERESPREYLNRESHYLWGDRYLLKIIIHDAPPTVEISHRQMIMRIRQNWSHDQKKVFLESWYRDQVKEALPRVIRKWESKMGVRVNRFFVQKMKTQWGSCNPCLRNIRLNTELAKKPRNHLEYVVVHEMAHLMETSHGPRFIALMDRFLPQWRAYRKELNQLPLGAL